MIELNTADLVSDLLLPLYTLLIFILPVLCSFLRDVALVLVEALLSLLDVCVVLKVSLPISLLCQLGNRKHSPLSHFTSGPC